MEKSGWKNIADQFIAYPFIGPLEFTDRRDLILPGNSKESLAFLHSYLESNRQKYLQFIHHKSCHPSIDIYACFQPFNEAFKALYSFVSYLQTQLQPGDIVLNCWDRSGWTAAMLAGWFPQQEIWTIWEGDKDILGYKGFDYWMSPDRRKYHKIFFADFFRPLPIASGTISAVIGFDLLHRFNQPELLKEIQRITKPSAPIVFPHVHLTNNFPEPFFERGCRQLHGKEYDYLFNALEPITQRRGYILSEPATFQINDFGKEEALPLMSTPGHADYNGCVAWLDPSTGPYLKPWRGHQFAWHNYFLLQNPMLVINSINNKIQWNLSLYGSQIGELLDRHIIYKYRVTPSIDTIVAKEWKEILYWAGEGKTLDQIISLTGFTPAYLQAFLEECWQLDLAQAVPVDYTGFRLQTLLGQQKYLPEKHEQELYSFWKQSVTWHSGETWIKTEQETLTYLQGDELIALTKKALINEGLIKGDKLFLCADMHYETLIIFWAAVSLGIIIVPVSTGESAISIQKHLERIPVSMAFVDPKWYPIVRTLLKGKVVMTDLQDEPLYDMVNSFEAMLSKHMDVRDIEYIVPVPEDIAVILSTTGSTGNPKAIPLTHAQLVRSGRLMTEMYHWKKKDRFYALGGLETMSGLRNAAICTAEAGAVCVLPERGNTIYRHYDIIQREQITILTANPLFFKQLLFAAHTAGTSKPLSSIRLALSTGNALPAKIRDDWRQKTGSVLMNYYGLTETSGICIAEIPFTDYTDERSIGKPVGCLIKIVDEQGDQLLPGETGELCIYGAGIFNGYYQNKAATASALKRGWFHTKDLATIMEDGTVCLRGRIADLVKLPSGERIELSAIEEVIADIDLISDWAVCPMKEYEKESMAIFFVPVEIKKVEEIVQQIKILILEKIGAYAVPKLIAAVENIPRGNHNKVIRSSLTGQFVNV